MCSRVRIETSQVMHGLSFCCHYVPRTTSVQPSESNPTDHELHRSQQRQILLLQDVTRVLYVSLYNRDRVLTTGFYPHHHLNAPNQRLFFDELQTSINFKKNGSFILALSMQTYTLKSKIFMHDSY